MLEMFVLYLFKKKYTEWVDSTTFGLFRRRRIKASTYLSALEGSRHVLL